MRKRELEVTDARKIKEILDKCRVLHLGLSEEDQPYVVPMSYGYTYEGDTLVLYLHGGMEGYKYEVIKKNPKVSFAMECDVVPFSGKAACQYGITYSSIMGKGMAEIVEEVQEKEQALSILMKTQTGKDFEFNERLVSIVNVIKITVTEYSAKHRPLPPALAAGSEETV